jgi:hypothetical protein
MAGDYTRMTFDPLLDRAMVLQQQGRVGLDADFNELVEMLERRVRVETRDFTGPAVVPATIPNSFEIKLTGSKLSIAPGRMYVDGLLAENHGYGKLIYEPVWDEPDYDGWTPLDKQPYLGSPVSPNVKGNQLVYLDVWQREQTYVEDQTMLESGLGVDTCTRVQTVWQVKLLPAKRGMRCASNFPNFPPPLSSGRLTSQANKPPAPTDPCAVAPVGGYRGLENRLYRVEIHDGGDLNTATFKWSRDNGAVASVVSAVDDTSKPQVITVQRLGRDQLLRFHQNDWVELLDDTHELDGKPGLIGQIGPPPDPATNTITLTSPLGGAIDMNRNPRLRRWDQQAGVSPHGVIPVSPAPGSGFFDLEDGVQVKLELADPAGSFKTGDWWVFAARAASASVEQLNAVPPRGIRHHYAKLAVIVGGKVTDDCRVIFPGECEGGDCECAACVTPKSHADGSLTIQAAIDKVKAQGGKVCLQAGVYQLKAPVTIQSARALQLVGKGHKTVLVYDGPGPAIDIEQSMEVTIERLAVATSSSGLGKFVGSAGWAKQKRNPEVELAIAVQDSLAVTIERCFLAQGAPAFAAGRTQVVVSHQPESRALGGIGIGLGGILAGISIRHNVIFAEVGVGLIATGGQTFGVTHREVGGQMIGGGISRTRDTDAMRIVDHTRGTSWGANLRAFMVSIGLVIEQNTLFCWRAGIDLVRFAGAAQTTALVLHLAETRVSENSIYGCSDVGILLGGENAFKATSALAEARSTSAPSSKIPLAAATIAALAQLSFAGASRVDVTANLLSVSGAGIAVGANGVRIADNDVVIQSSTGTSGSSATGADLHGIQICVTPNARYFSDLLIDGNRVHGAQQFGIAIGAVVDSAFVRGNQVSKAIVGGIGTVTRGVPFSLAIEDNQVREIGPDVEDPTISPAGIYVAEADQLTVARNEVQAVGRSSTSSQSRFGVSAFACQSARVTGNDISDIGPPSAFVGDSVGIEIGGEFSHIEVTENSVLYPDYEAGGPETGNCIGLEILEAAPQSESAMRLLSRAEAGSGSDDRQAEAERLLRERNQRARDMETSIGVPVVRFMEDRVLTVSADGVSTAGATPGGDVAVRGNLFEGAGGLEAAFVWTQGSCIFAENRCRMPASDQFYAVAWLIATETVIASSNRLEGPSTLASLSVWVDSSTSSGEAAATLIGNIANGIFWLQSSDLTNTPWEPLNLQL